MFFNFWLFYWSIFKFSYVLFCRVQSPPKSLIEAVISSIFNWYFIACISVLKFSTYSFAVHGFLSILEQDYNHLIKNYVLTPKSESLSEYILLPAPFKILITDPIFLFLCICNNFFIVCCMLWMTYYRTSGLCYLPFFILLF